MLVGDECMNGITISFIGNLSGCNRNSYFLSVSKVLESRILVELLEAFLNLLFKTEDWDKLLLSELDLLDLLES